MKKRNVHFLILFLFSLFTGSILAQQVVSGVISDDFGEVLPGVTVLEKGTNNGVVTDFDGKFDIEVEGTNSILVISFIGMKTKEIAVNGQTTLAITLQEDVSELDEIVIVGYGEQSKSKVTGAVGEIKGDFLENKPVVNIQELLTGKVAGLNITNSSGQPGSGASINIRGTSTIGGSSGVLVIIDGVPGNINTVNPNDIESVSVLKDAASAAIYGARAANGVLLVTTKKLKGGSALKVALTASYGWQNPQHYIDFVGGEDFMKLYNLASLNDGNTDAPYKQQDFDDLANGVLPDHQWNRELFLKNQPISNSFLSFAGSNERMNYSVGLGYDTQAGMIPNDNYKRIIAHPKFEFKIADWLSILTNTQYTKTNIQRPQGGNTNINQSYRISPITPIFTPEGRYWGPGGIPGGNPIAVINEGGRDNSEYHELVATFSAIFKPMKNQEWHIIPFYSHSYFGEQTHNYTKPITLYNSDETVFSSDPLSNQRIYDGFGRTTTDLTQISTDYTKVFNEVHEISVLALYSQELKKGSGFNASRLSPSFENIYVLDIADGVKDNSGTAWNESIASYVGRVSYNYKGKYLAEATVRRDGTSRFKEGYRWGVFPSYSVGWNIHKEDFWGGIKNTFSQFKIRVSYGELGDALKVSRYETRNILGFNSGAYVFDGALVPGASATASFIDNLSWERSKQSNLGFELGFFENKLNMTIDVFKNIRDQILYREPVPLEYGLSAPFTNTLEMESKGFEFTTGYRETFGDFSFNVNFNISTTKNKVLDLKGSGPWIGNSSITEVGAALELPYGLQADGLFQSQADIDNSATQINVKPGNIKYVDQDGNGSIGPEDRVVLNDKNPYRYGLNLGFNYKDFSLSINAYGVANTYRYISGYEAWAFFLANNARPMHKDSWTETNLDASYPRLSLNIAGNDTEFSDYWLRKSDYLKLQNITFSYNLTKILAKNSKVDNATVSLIGQNIATFSNFEGVDPEGGIYPQPRIITISLQLNF